MTIMSDHQYREIIQYIEDTEQRANYVREHKRELKWHKEAVGFTAAT